MTSETKIGLVVGLGFIVTFAVILSKKASVAPYALLENDIAVGEEGSVTVVKSIDDASSEPTTATSSHAMARGEVVQPALPTRRDAMSNAERSIVLRVNNPQAQNGLPIHGAAPGPVAGGPQQSNHQIPATVQSSEHAIDEITLENIRLPDVELPREASAEQRRSGEEVTVKLPGSSGRNGQAIPNRAASANKKPAKAKSSIENSVKREPRVPSVQPKEKSNTNTKEKDVQKERLKKSPVLPSPRRRPKFKEYYVRKGDSLIKIAKAFFGTSRQEIVDSLYEANRDRMADRHSLKLNQKLRIPSWIPVGQAEPADGFVAARVHSRVGKTTEGSGDSDSRNPLRKLTGHESAMVLRPVTKIVDKNEPANKNPTPKKPTRYRAYTVREKDTFSTIAETEMGTSRLWKELFEANKERFAKPESLRSGAVIRIPVSGLASSQGVESETEQ